MWDFRAKNRKVPSKLGQIGHPIMTKNNPHNNPSGHSEFSILYSLFQNSEIKKKKVLKRTELKQLFAVEKYIIPSTLLLECKFKTETKILAAPFNL